MSQKPKSRLPLLLGMVLALGVAVWWDRSGDGTSTDVPIAATRAPLSTDGDDAARERAEAAAARSLAHPLETLLLETLGETLARPLLEPARRMPMVPQAPPPPPPQAAAPARQPAAAPKHRLLGVVLSPDRAVALLAGDNGTPVRAELGDSVDGWVVARISRTEVHLSRDGRQQVLTLPRR